MKAGRKESYHSQLEKSYSQRIIIIIIIMSGLIGSFFVPCNAFYISKKTKNCASRRLFYNKVNRKTIITASSDTSDAKNNTTTTETGSNSRLKILDPLIVCGPSGVGKGTIISRYMEEFDGKHHFGFTTSHTTRKSRTGEVHGVHYHFTTLPEMEQRINDGEFLEYARVHGNYYGTSWSSLQKVYEKTGKRCLLDIDIQGVERIRSIADSDSSVLDFVLKPKYIFIAPPSLDTLRKRLVQRGTETHESIERRTANAQKELEYGLEPGNFDKIVTNDDLDRACQNFDRCIRDLYHAL